MPEVAIVELPTEGFVLGRALADVDDYSVRLTQFVPTSNRLVPFFWIESDTIEAVEPTLREHPRIADLTKYDQQVDRTLCQVEWEPPLDEFLLALRETDVLVSKAWGTPDFWEFELFAGDRDQLSVFHTTCREREIPLEIRQLFRAGPSSTQRAGITDKQHEILRLAYQRGYFEVPREVTVTELAGDLDISPQAASKRLRRGLVSVLEYVLHDP